MNFMVTNWLACIVVSASLMRELSYLEIKNITKVHDYQLIDGSNVSVSAFQKEINFISIYFINLVDASW